MKKFVFSVLVALPLMLFISCSSIGNNEERIHEVSEDFCITIIDVGVENITFVPSVDGKCKVVCYAENKLEHLVKVYDGKLKIESDDRRNWVEKFFAFCTEENSITVYLPTDIETSLLVTGDTGNIIIPADFTFDHINIILDTGNVVCNASAKHQIVIKSDTGDVQINDCTAEDVKLETATGNIAIYNSECKTFSAITDTGDITASNINCGNDFVTAVDTGNLDLSDVTCKSFASNGDSGDVKLVSVLAEELLTIKTSTGDISFERCDGTEVKITTDTGDVRGSFLTDKIVYASTDTGRVQIPHSTVGGLCEINTDTGNIIITFE